MAFDVGGMGIYIGTDRKLVKEVNRIENRRFKKSLRKVFPMKRSKERKELPDGKPLHINAVKRRHSNEYVSGCNVWDEAGLLQSLAQTH